jgi:hypothetical protein
VCPAEETHPDLPPSRREFTQTLAVLATGGSLVAFPGEASGQAPAADPVADALFETIRIRYGRFLTPVQLDALRRSMHRYRQNAEQLRQVRLDNADEPAFAFRADLP